MADVSDASPDAFDLASIATELMLEFRRSRDKAREPVGHWDDGEAGYRISKFNLHTQPSTGTGVTWLLHTRTYLKNSAIDQGMVARRAALVKLGGEILAWISDIDRRSA